MGTWENIKVEVFVGKWIGNDRLCICNFLIHALWGTFMLTFRSLISNKKGRVSNDSTLLLGSLL
jgi:hypothetical protein